METNRGEALEEHRRDGYQPDSPKKGTPEDAGRHLEIEMRELGDKRNRLADLMEAVEKSST